MQLSVVIVSYNAKYFLELCLFSVKKAIKNLDAEIIVVDNLSTDDTCQLIKDKFSDVKLIANKQNLGFAKANNLGVSKAKGKFILILNPDTVVAEDTFTNCINYINTLDKPGAVGVKLIDGSGYFLPESKRNLPTPLVTLYKMLGIHSKRNAYYAQHIGENETGKVKVLVGAFMFIKRQTYIDLGGFDTDYFMYGEDIDLSYKLLKNGYQNYYLGNNKVIHFKGESTQKNVKYLKYFYKAMYLFYGKHFERNFIFELFLKLGMILWFWIKYFQLKFINPKPLKGNKAIYVGDNKVLFNKIKGCYNELDFGDISTYRLIENKPFNWLFIDLNKWSFKTLIQILEQYKSKAHKFRMILPNTDIIVGSDSSSGNGENVILN